MADRSLVYPQLCALAMSMYTGQPVVMTGSDAGGVNTVVSVVNSIEREDGSGNNFNVSFVGGDTLYANLSKAVVVRNPSYIIPNVWKKD